MKRYIGFIALLAIIAFAWRWYQKPRIVNGEKVLPFSLKLADGQMITEKSFPGKYIILHFWGSWCGPCRKENPYLTALEQKYATKQLSNSSGIVTVHIGIEKSADSWKNAILQDGLSGEYHWSDFTYFDNELAKNYGVREIPALFLINPRGVIVCARQSVLELDRFLATQEVAASK